MRKDILILLMSLFFLNATANAGVNLSKTRVVIDKNNDYSGNVRVNNVGDEEVLIQAWIDDGTNKVKGSHFLVTPPVRRLGGKKSSTLKLDLTGLKAKQISSLEEQVYYLNVKSIPKRNNVDNKFLIATNSRIKVFVRPESLAGISSLTDVKRNLTAIQTSQGFQIINDSNFSLNFEFIEVLD
uniref:fimbrial biogenesis chaperone n=1 Tax=uncultured Vibrio sp. TaxID=114054 RepID=UPI00263723F0